MGRRLKEYEYEAYLMGSNFHLAIISETEKEAQKAFEKALQYVTEYENTFSRFKKESELSRLNDLGEIAATDRFLEVITIGKQLAVETEGAFNLLLQVTKVGYIKNFEDIRFSGTTSPVEIVPYNISYSDIEIDRNKKTIKLGEGQKIDVAGYLKGNVAEKISELLRRFSGAVVNVGGDIFTHGRDAQGEKFFFYVLNPITLEEVRVSILNSAIATSGTYKRKWEAGGKERSHILDKSGTKNPDSDLVSATVIAPHGHQADAYATAAIVLGREEAKALLEKRGFSYLLITTEGAIDANIIYE